MEITGRVTADAQVRNVKDDKKVVGFSIAINDSYRSKDKEQVQVTTYVDCSYWLNPGIAAYLKKGTLVELYGRIGVSAWADKEGRPQASLTFHTNNIKLLGRANGSNTERVNSRATEAAAAYNDANSNDDDLPF